jgi:hypothetical protein
VVVVEYHAGIRRRPRIGWQQTDFGPAVQHDQFPVAARPDPDQRRPGPRIHQPAARSAVQYRAPPVGRIDQTGSPYPVLTGQDRRHLYAVPRDQLGGPVVIAVDAPGHPVVGIGRDHPDLLAAAPDGRHFAGQPLTVGGMDDPRDRTLDRQLDVAGRAGPPAAQKALHRSRITAVVDEVGERRRIRG